MSTADWRDADDALLLELRAALADGPPVPERLLCDARSAFAWRNVDQELERLLLESDSLFDVAGVRGDAENEPRVLVFEGNGIGLEVEIGQRKIVGQILPMRAALITVIGAAGPAIETRTDELGCFVVERVSGGPIRFRCDTQDSGFVTDWLSC